jgi:hypothetical protein
VEPTESLYAEFQLGCYQSRLRSSDHGVGVQTEPARSCSHPRFVGAANIGVENISPHSPPFDPNHGVTFVVDVDWGSPLHVVTDITVLDQPPVDIEVQSG